MGEDFGNQADFELDMTNTNLVAADVAFNSSTLHPIVH